MLEVLDRIVEGKGESGDIELLEELSYMIKDTALCGLGQTGPNPVLSTLRHFREEYEAHIYEKKCPAKVCKALIRFEVDEEKCKKCGICYKKCPAGAIEWEKKHPAHINKEKCVKCMTCIINCPADAIF